MEDPGEITIKDFSEGPQSSEDPRGSMIVRFTPKDQKSNLFFFVLIIALFMVLLTVIPIEDLFEVIPFGIMILVLSIAYMILMIFLIFISVFDDITFYEFGFYPPLQQERPLNAFRRIRTFIHFAEIEELSITPMGDSKFLIIKFRARRRPWHISGKWDTKLLAPIFQMGVQNKRLPLPQGTQVHVKEKQPGLDEKEIGG